ALWRLDHEAFRLVHNLFQLADGYGTLLTGVQQPVQHFLTLKFFAAAVFFHHHVGNFVDALIGSEAFGALQALATPADGIGFLAFARLHHFVVGKSAIRTLHGAWELIAL